MAGVAVILAMLPCKTLASTGPIIITGKIYTAEDANPVVEAVVVEAGKFSFVGSKEDALAYAPNADSVRDLGTDIAYPGFV